MNVRSFAIAALLISFVLPLSACLRKRSSVAEGCSRYAAFAVPRSSVASVEPRGWVDPAAGRISPADSIRVVTSEEGASLLSPGSIQIVKIYAWGAAPDEFQFDFESLEEGCEGQRMSFRWKGKIDAFFGGVKGLAIPCPSEGCVATTDIWLGEGDVLGTLAEKSFEMKGLNDEVCATEYFGGDLRAWFDVKLGASCGSASFTNVSGKAAGTWNSSGAVVLALVPDTVNSTKYWFSIGSGLPGLAAGKYGFAIEASGFRNRAFSEIIADGRYCFDALTDGDAASVAGSLILELISAGSLRLQKSSASCPALRGDLSFGASTDYADYQR